MQVIEYTSLLMVLRFVRGSVFDHDRCPSCQKPWARPYFSVMRPRRHASECGFYLRLDLRQLTICLNLTKRQ